MTKTAISKLLITGSLIGLLYSCVDLDVEKQYLADAYISTKIIDGDTLFAIESCIQANDIMTGVKMKNPDSIEVNLKKISASYYEYIVADSFFTSQQPHTGNYIFSVFFADETAVTTVDNLTADIIKPTQIKEVKINNVDKIVSVEWIKNDKAVYYTVKILKNDTILYSSGLISDGYSSATIYPYSGNWAINKNPKGGETYDLIVSAILTEKDATKYFEIQAISQSSKSTFVWPE